MFRIFLSQALLEDSFYISIKFLFPFYYSLKRIDEDLTLELVYFSSFRLVLTKLAKDLVPLTIQLDHKDIFEQ